MSERPDCAYCGKPMVPWRSPEGFGWGEAVLFVCFNDDCPYYVEGWEWMKSKFDVTASYRHQLNPQTGKSAPLPVWSPQAHRDAIIENGEEV